MKITSLMMMINIVLKKNLTAKLMSNFLRKNMYVFNNFQFHNKLSLLLKSVTFGKYLDIVGKI